MIRICILLLGVLLLGFGADAALAQDSSDLDGTPLKAMDIRSLDLELQRDETALRDFRNLIGRLESAAKKSNNTDRRRAVENLRNAMADKILQAEDYLGQEHTLRRHGQEVTVATTSEVEETTASGKIPQTGRKIRYQGPADLYNAFYRLVRMQEIFTSCRTLEEHAIAKSTESLQRYLNLTTEFANLMETDVQEIRDLRAEVEARLAAEADTTSQTPPGEANPYEDD